MDLKKYITPELAEEAFYYAFENADIVYPKSWGIEDLFHKPEEALEIKFSIE